MVFTRKYKTCLSLLLIIIIILLCNTKYFKLYLRSSVNSSHKFELYEQIKTDVKLNNDGKIKKPFFMHFTALKSKEREEGSDKEGVRAKEGSWLEAWFRSTDQPLLGKTIRYINSLGENLITEKASRVEKENKEPLVLSRERLEQEARLLNITVAHYMSLLNSTKKGLQLRQSVAETRRKSEVKPGADLSPVQTVFSDARLNIARPRRVRTHKQVWQVQEDDCEIYLYTAFYDDRPALSRPQLRVIAVAETRVSNLVCLIWYENQFYPDISRAFKKEVSSKISPQLKKQYEAYVFSCNLLANKTSTPSHVSVVTTNQKTPTNLLPVEYPEKLPEESRIEFGHCMSVLYWDHNPYRIVEWMELHRIWGIGEFNIYANTLNKNIYRILEYYASIGILNLFDITNVIDDDSEWTILLDMSPAINDCYYRNMYRYKYIMCTDTDEMIVPMLHREYSSMLKYINTEQQISHPAPSYIFRNVYFFTDFGPVYDTPVILHTQRYTRHVTPSPFGYSAKSITNPQACIGLQNHICWKRVAQLDKPGWLVDVALTTGMSCHYKKCHFDEYLDKEGECDVMMGNYSETDSVRRFGAQLYPRVRDILLSLDMM